MRSLLHFRAAMMVCLLFIGFVMYYHAFSKTTWFASTRSKSVVKATINEAVHVINFRQTADETLLLNRLDKEEPFSCPVVNFVDANATFPICVFPKSADSAVSAHVQNDKQYWEKHLIVPTMKFARRLMRKRSPVKDVVFIDIGTNIGAYSLPIIQTGVKVLSIDAQWEAIRRFAFSLRLANVTEQAITILHNAVTNETGSLLDLRVHQTNAGATLIVPSGLCPIDDRERDCRKGVVRSITLNDLIPLVIKSPGVTAETQRPQVIIKADIECTEPLVFRENVASTLFEETNVILVQMELNLLKDKNFFDERRAREAMFLFFTSRGYSMRSAGLPGYSLSPRDCLDLEHTEVWFIQKGLEDTLLSWMRE